MSTIIEVERYQKLHNKVAIVTGGASGIGRAGALLFASEGARVVIADINEEAGSKLCESIRQSGLAASFCPVDVRVTSSVEELVTDTIRRYQRIDVLFHNAMNCKLVNEQDRRTTELPEEIWTEITNLVLSGTYRCCKAVGRQMVRQQSGSIILTATTDALVGCAGYDAYTAAKGGVVSMTRSLAAGLGREGVRVNSICPGFVSTPQQLEWLKKPGADEMMRALHLLPIARPEHIAAFALYLASDDAAVVTGGIFPVDSGYTAFKANLDIAGLLSGAGDDADRTGVRL
jgi:NAD(P)-dependent dehydrogenase (short-subunit alcohol dehydrogenase family)